MPVRFLLASSLETKIMLNLLGLALVLKNLTALKPFTINYLFDVNLVCKFLILGGAGLPNGQ
jgi:hypothetical protein